VSGPLDELSVALRALGCPAEKSAEMASQLDKRARQLAALKSQSYEEALQFLLGLMAQGWAAQERIGGGLNRGVRPSPPKDS